MRRWSIMFHWTVLTVLLFAIMDVPMETKPRFYLVETAKGNNENDDYCGSCPPPSDGGHAAKEESPDGSESSPSTPGDEGSDGSVIEKTDSGEECDLGNLNGCGNIGKENGKGNVGSGNGNGNIGNGDGNGNVGNGNGNGNESGTGGEEKSGENETTKVPENESEPEPEGEENEPTKRPENESESEPEGEPEVKPEVKPEGEPEVKPEGGSEIEGEENAPTKRPANESEPEPEGEENEPTKRPENESESEPEDEPEVKPEGEPEVKPEGGSETEVEENAPTNRPGGTSEKKVKTKLEENAYQSFIDACSKGVESGKAFLEDIIDNQVNKYTNAEFSLESLSDICNIPNVGLTSLPGELKKLLTSGTQEKNIKMKLGGNAYQMFIDACSKNEVPKEKLLEISKLVSKESYEFLKNYIQKQKGGYKGAEAGKAFLQYWALVFDNQETKPTKTEFSLESLIDICNNPKVGLTSLAEELENLPTSGTSEKKVEIKPGENVYQMFIDACSKGTEAGISFLEPLINMFDDKGKKLTNSGFNLESVNNICNNPKDVLTSLPKELKNILNSGIPEKYVKMKLGGNAYQMFIDACSKNEVPKEKLLEISKLVSKECYEFINNYIQKQKGGYKGEEAGKAFLDHWALIIDNPGSKETKTEFSLESLIDICNNPKVGLISLAEELKNLSTSGTSEKKVEIKPGENAYQMFIDACSKGTEAGISFLEPLINMFDDKGKKLTNSGFNLESVNNICNNPKNVLTSLPKELKNILNSGIPEKYVKMKLGGNTYQMFIDACSKNEVPKEKLLEISKLVSKECYEFINNYIQKQKGGYKGGAAGKAFLDHWALFIDNPGSKETKTEFSLESLIDICNNPKVGLTSLAAELKNLSTKSTSTGDGSVTERTGNGNGCDTQNNNGCGNIGINNGIENIGENNGNTNIGNGNGIGNMRHNLNGIGNVGNGNGNNNEGENVNIGNGLGNGLVIKGNGDGSVPENTNNGNGCDTQNNNGCSNIGIENGNIGSNNGNGNIGSGTGNGNIGNGNGNGNIGSGNGNGNIGNGNGNTNIGNGHGNRKIGSGFGNGNIGNEPASEPESGLMEELMTKNKKGHKWGRRK